MLREITSRKIWLKLCSTNKRTTIVLSVEVYFQSFPFFFFLELINQTRNPNTLIGSYESKWSAISATDDHRASTSIIFPTKTKKNADSPAGICYRQCYQFLRDRKLLHIYGSITFYSNLVKTCITMGWEKRHDTRGDVLHYRWMRCSERNMRKLKYTQYPIIHSTINVNNILIVYYVNINNKNLVFFFNIIMFSI